VKVSFKNTIWKTKKAEFHVDYEDGENVEKMTLKKR
jgi:hypothetical protein